MPLVRRSTTGDRELLDEAPGAQQRAAEVAAAYAAYDTHPLGEHDEWGDLASFRSAVDCSG